MDSTGVVLESHTAPQQGVAPIGFEMQAMEEGVSPSPANQQPVSEVFLNPPVLGNSTKAADSNQSDGSPNRDQSKRDKSLYLKDGKRCIDFVLAYKVPTDPDEKKDQRREEFEKQLQTEFGLELETEKVQYEEEQTIVFTKVHGPWKVLTVQAEIMNMKMPIAENDLMESITSCWSKCPTPFDYDQDILPALPDYFTAPFSRQRAEQFIIQDEETFFSSAQRSLLVYQVLSRCPFDNTDPKRIFGIKKLLSSGCYDAAYPLHEGEYTSEHSLLTRGKENDRHLLYETWARPGVWYKFQPLDHIRMYFGEKIAIYFAWLGYYTGQLIPAALVGIAVFLYGAGTVGIDDASKAICNQTGTGAHVMCPLCDMRCDYWKLSRSCTYSTITYFFDNEATVFFACFMALWAMFFIEMWKRRTAEIEYDWDVADFEEEETVRPEFEASVKKRRRSPIYGRNDPNSTEEPYLSMSDRLWRYVSSLWVVLFMLVVVLAAVFGVIVYRMTVSVLLFSRDQAQIKQWTSTITSVTAACINLVCIIILGKVYLVIARALTNFESHRTQTEWEDSFTLKMFLFQFVNHFASLFYIAFFKGKLIGRPGMYNREINKARQEECDPSGCLIELLIQLFIIMVGKQAINNIKEILIPKLMNWFKSRRAKEDAGKKNKEIAQWEKDFAMSELPDLGLFDEYLEMVIQYGFVTIFVAAFPLAPMFALINNVIEVRLDAYKFVTQLRRPLAARAQDIGIWFAILQGLMTVSVATNAAIIAFTSEFVPKLVYRYGYNNSGSLQGYVDFSLSIFNVSDFEKESLPSKTDFNDTQCSYRDFREPPGHEREYQFKMEHWHILTARLAFVIVFILVVVFLQWLIAFLVPDTPRAVKMQILREKHLAREALVTQRHSNPS